MSTPRHTTSMMHPRTRMAALMTLALAAVGLFACPPTDTVELGFTEADHDERFFPVSENDDASVKLQGNCDGDATNPCSGLTGSHQCSSLDVKNTFARAFCQDTDPFQSAKATLTGSLQGSYSCEACHGTNGSFKVLRCAECHLTLPIVPPGDARDLDGAKSPDDRHRHVGGFAVDTQICASCHAENFDTDRNGAFNRNDLSAANGDRVSGHPRFLIDVDTPHYRMSCNDCHVKNRVDKEWAIDFKINSCDRCHANNDMEIIHKDAAGVGLVQRVGNQNLQYNAPNDPSCITCHADGSANLGALVSPP